MGDKNSPPAGTDISDHVRHQPSGHLKSEAPLRKGRGNNDDSGGDGKLDETVDEFKGYFELMDNLTPLFERWRAHSCADPGQKAKWNAVQVFGEQDKRDIQQLRGLNVGYLAGLTQRLHNAGLSMDELKAHAKSMGNSLDDSWNSKSSEKAVEKFTDLSSNSRDCKDQLDELSTHVRGMHKAAYNAKKTLLETLDAVCAKGKGIIDREGTIGDGGDEAKEERDGRNKSIEEIDTAIRNGMRYSPGYFSSGDYRPSTNPQADRQEAHASDQRRPGDHTTDFKEPGSFGPAELRSPGFCYLPETEKYSDQVARQMDSTCARYFGSLRYYRNTVKNVHNSLNGAMNDLRSGVGSLQHDPFKDLVAPGDAPPKEHQPKKDTGDGGKNQQPPPQASSDDTGRAGSGGDQPPVNTGGTGPSSTGNQPPPGGDTGPGATGQPTPDQGSTPRTPGPDPTRTDPSQMQGATGGPGQNGGQPNMPGGQPRVPGQDGGQPETVKIHTPKAGDIEMTSPDGQGHMKLTVDDGSGKPKTYDVDFGEQSGQQAGTSQAGAGAGGSSPDGAAQAGAQGAGGQPGLGGDQDSLGAAGGADGGQQGSGAQGAGDDAGQPVHADQSGHAVIHDGGNTLTVDKAPGSDEVKLTVDDGSGKPTTYTVDSTGQTSPASTGNHLAGGGDGGPGVAAGLGGSDLGVGAGPGQGDQLQHGALSGADSSAGQHPGPGVAGGLGGDGASGAPGVAAPDGGGGATDPGGGGGAPGHGGPAPTAQPGQQAQMQPGAMSGADPNLTGGQGASGGGAPHGGGGAPHGGGGSGAAGGPGGGSGGHAGGGGAIPPMMGGGMGGGGAGGDSARGTSSWRTEGNLFDDGGADADEIEEMLNGAQQDPWG